MNIQFSSFRGITREDTFLKNLYFIFLTLHFGLFFAGFDADIPFYATVLIGIAYCFVKQRVKFNSVVFRLIGFMVVVFVSLMWTINYDATNIVYTVIKYVIGAVILYQVIESDKDIRWFFNTLLISATFVLINTIVNVGGFSGLYSVLLNGFRIGEDIGGINGIGQVLSMGFCLSFYRVLCLKKFRVGFLALSIVFFVAAVATGSKRALFIMLLFVFSVVFFKNRKNFLKLLLVTGVLIGAVLLIKNLPFMSFLSSRLDEFFSVLQGTNANEDSTDAMRMKLILHSFTLFFYSPIWGHGVDSTKLLNYKEFGIAYSTHNVYADIIANFGLLGILTFISIGISSVFNIIKNIRGSTHSISNSLAFLTSFYVSVIFMTNIASVSYQNSMLIYAFYIVLSRANEIISQKGGLQI